MSYVRDYFMHSKTNKILNISNATCEEQGPRIEPILMMSATAKPEDKWMLEKSQTCECMEIMYEPSQTEQNNSENSLHIKILS